MRANCSKSSGSGGFPADIERTLLNIWNGETYAYPYLMGNPRIHLRKLWSTWRGANPRKPVTTHLGRLPCLATMPAHQALNYFPSTSNGWLGLEDGSMIYNPADVQNNLAERKASMYALVDRVRSVGISWSRTRTRSHWLTKARNLPSVEDELGCLR